jgi:hypothetical protein
MRSLAALGFGLLSILFSFPAQARWVDQTECMGSVKQLTLANTQLKFYSTSYAPDSDSPDKPKIYAYAGSNINVVYDDGLWIGFYVPNQDTVAYIQKAFVTKVCSPTGSRDAHY